MIDLKLFEKWLMLRRYITTKENRKKIIDTYKRLFKEGKSIIDLEEAIEKLEYKNKKAAMSFDYELTVADISKYLLYEDYRRKENRKIENCESL